MYPMWRCAHEEALVQHWYFYYQLDLVLQNVMSTRSKNKKLINAARDEKFDDVRR